MDKNLPFILTVIGLFGFSAVMAFIVIRLVNSDKKNKNSDPGNTGCSTSSCGTDTDSDGGDSGCGGSGCGGCGGD